MSDWFPVKVWLRQGCVMPPWISIYVEDVVQEVNARQLGRGLSVLSDDGKEWNAKKLLLANDNTGGCFTREFKTGGRGIWEDV